MHRPRSNHHLTTIIGKLYRRVFKNLLQILTMTSSRELSSLMSFSTERACLDCWYIFFLSSVSNSIIPNFFLVWYIFFDSANSWSNSGAFLFKNLESSVKSINSFFNSSRLFAFIDNALASMVPLKYGKASLIWQVWGMVFGNALPMPTMADKTTIYNEKNTMIIVWRNYVSWVWHYQLHPSSKGSCTQMTSASVKGSISAVWSIMAINRTLSVPICTCCYTLCSKIRIFGPTDAVNPKFVWPPVLPIFFPNWLQCH